jgi:hypothetical protein
MIDLKPHFTPEVLSQIANDMPRVEQALFHAEQAGIDPEPRLIELVVGRATYHWITGRLDSAREGFEKAIHMCEAVFGAEHPTTIITRARLDAIETEIAQCS